MCGNNGVTETSWGGSRAADLARWSARVLLLRWGMGEIGGFCSGLKQLWRGGGHLEEVF